MSKNHKTVSKRHGPAKRIAPETWERHKAVLQRLYLEQRLPLTEVMKDMKQNCKFDATQKQFRYRFEKWKWPKYGQKHSQSPEIQSDSPADANPNGALETIEGSDTTADSDQEHGDNVTPSSSDWEDITDRDISTLRQQFLSVFSEVCYPIPDPVKGLVAASLRNSVSEETRSMAKDAAIGVLVQCLGLADGSLNVIAYHHLNYALGKRTEVKDENQERHDEPAISRHHAIEQQPWYRNFDESSPASRCISSCLEWINQQLKLRLPRETALSYFDTLDGDGNRSVSRQDVHLFIYLVDAWLGDATSEGGHYSDNCWDELSERATGVSSIEMLRIMSSLIVDAARLDSEPAPQRRSARNICSGDNNNGDQLINSALSGVEAMESDKRTLVREFVTEFVWIHDPSHQLSEERSRFEAEARRAAEAYADAKLCVPIEPACELDGAASDDTGSLGDDSDNSTEE